MFGKEKLLRARFKSRPNRFITYCTLNNGQTVKAHMPNPGRMQELLLPGVTLFLRKRPADSPGATRYTVTGVLREGHRVFLDTLRTNQAAADLINRGAIPGLKGARIERAEVVHGKSRFDFLLRYKGKPLYLEVKSCTLYGNGVAMFPDAVTERGRRHLLELAELGKKGVQTAVLIFIHVPHISHFLPDFHTDPAFAQAFLKVKDHVRLLPVAAQWDPGFELNPTVKRVAIPWAFLKKSLADGGNYLLIAEVRRRTIIDAGGLGCLTFKKGYYIYAGSAMGGLDARIARHVRKSKKMHWHIDYLAAKADKVTPLPIRGFSQQECAIAEDLGKVYKAPHTRFGSSDCRCDTHLFYSAKPPLQERQFHRILEKYRMRIK